jgi:gliding motility-associated-like protein
MNPGLGGYRIYASENGGPYTLVTTLPDTVNSYPHTGLTKDAVYCYFIQAFDSLNTKTSMSNIVCELAHQPGQPQFLYLRYATIANNDHVNLRVFVDTAAWVKEYRVYRSMNQAGPYDFLDKITPQQPAVDDFIEYDDYTAYIHDQSYYYKVTVIDSCGVEVLESNLGRTILLKAWALDNFTNTIEWNNYEDWLGSVSSFNIYRATDDNWSLTPIANMPPSLTGVNTFNDDIDQYTETGGKFTYYIEALEGPGNPYFYQDKSISNQAIVEQPPRVFVPNAFSPKGYNSRFYPVAVFVKSDDYIFRIFNRWGQLLYDTNIPGPLNGWDGKYEGKFVPAGVYVYYVRFKTATGDYFEKRGTVTVIK